MAAEVGENAIDIALKVARALTAVGAEYFLDGSLASSLQGEPRATNDIDFVIALPLGKVGELAAALAGGEVPELPGVVTEADSVSHARAMTTDASRVRP
jgi:hypothetical protein